jgi:hypothetical protein
MGYAHIQGEANIYKFETSTAATLLGSHSIE